MVTAVAILWPVSVLPSDVAESIAPYTMALHYKCPRGFIPLDAANNIKRSSYRAPHTPWRYHTHRKAHPQQNPRSEQRTMFTNRLADTGESIASYTHC